MKNSEKCELIENCIDMGWNLEKATDKQVTCHIGWIEDVWVYFKVYLIINHKTAWFIIDNDKGFTISSDVLKSKVGKFTPVDNVYLKLNDMVTEAYNN